MGKNEAMIELFNHFISSFEQIGPIKLHATKSSMVLSNEKRIAYIINIGKIFIDVVFIFPLPFEDNLCFRKIALVPGTSDYNHHLRLMLPDDINEEVISFMKKSYASGKSL